MFDERVFPYSPQGATLEARSSRHVFIETMQSKEYSEILLIIVNFGVTASRYRHTSKAKIYIFSLDIRNIMGHVSF